MQRNRPVQPIGRGPQSFPQSNLPPIQSPMAMGQQPAPSAISPQEAIAEQMQDMALEIYCRVVSQHIAAGRVDREAMQTLALHSQTAAKAYFESLGVKFDA